MDYIPLNFKLLSHPVNWFIIILMVLIAGFAAHLVMPAISQLVNTGTDGA